MNFQLPTFKQAMEMVQTNEVFLHKVEEVDGFKAHIFNYRLANYQDFQTEGALEMRGLTFIEYIDGTDASCPTEYERFIHLHKFFNYGERGGFEGIEDSPIKSVQVKEDGSMIVPILWNGKIYCKTRGTFHSEQAQIANEIIAKNKQLEWFIRFCYGSVMIPIFEFVSPFNQIVLLYEKAELRLLQVRDMQTGRYFDISQLPDPGVKIREERYEGGNYIEGWLQKAETVTEMEGWVIEFENGHMVKIKTQWYVALHHLLTENLTRENEIISWVLNETLDDVLGQVPDTDLRKDYALDIAKLLRYIVSRWVDEIEGIMITLHPNKKNSRKDFAIKWKEHRWFGVLMKLFTEHESDNIKDDSIFNYLKDAILKQTNKWGEAQAFLRKLGFTFEHFKIVSEE